MAELLTHALMAELLTHAFAIIGLIVTLVAFGYGVLTIIPFSRH